MRVTPKRVNRNLKVRIIINKIVIMFGRYVFSFLLNVITTLYKEVYFIWK